MYNRAKEQKSKSLLIKTKKTKKQKSYRLQFETIYVNLDHKIISIKCLH